MGHKSLRSRSVCEETEIGKEDIVMKKLLASALALMMVLGLSSCGNTAQEGGYPHKTVTMIVPYGAGGTTDLVGRQLAIALGEALDVSIVVQNQAGASGSIGCQMALDAEPDGSTILFTADSLGTQRVMGISQLSYADYSPIMVTANDPKVIVVSKDSPYQTIEELLAAIEAAPGGVQMAYTGPGGSGHVQALIMNQFGYEPALTAYSSGSDGIVAVMSGQVVFTNSNYSSVASYLDSGDLRMLAVCANERMANHEDVPALSEVMTGSEEYMEIPYTPLSLLVDKDVPTEIQEQLRAACAEAVKDADFNAWMEENNVEKLYEKYTTTGEMTAFYSEWESVVSWLIHDAGAATYSPEDFGIAKPGN